eukprot:3130616-Amphidinium_carterae.1
MSYGSFGWMRRPFGRRLERFIGLTSSSVGGTEFYTDASFKGLEATTSTLSQFLAQLASQSRAVAPTSQGYALAATEVSTNAG